MKPGDLVRQAPNIFADREIGGKKMLLLSIDESSNPAIYTTLLDGEEREWYGEELEVWRETR
jgi:hypothetical protein|tara:strand:+ start:93 stop:278 length:186 start_codon:yes stop_codon:yes gene_type:complete